MRRKTRVLTPVFRQLSFSQLISTVCRILPHCAHAADMNFYLSIFWILIRTGIQRCRFWSISKVSFSFLPDLLSSPFPNTLDNGFSGRPVYLLILLLKMKLSRFCKSHKKKSLTKYRCLFTSILRQALVAMIAHTPIRSVRTFFLWKLTAMTDLQMGHLILMIPSTASGSASNSLLFLQHGHAMCTHSFIAISLPITFHDHTENVCCTWTLSFSKYFFLHLLLTEISGFASAG